MVQEESGGVFHIPIQQMAGFETAEGKVRSHPESQPREVAEDTSESSFLLRSKNGALLQ